MRWVRLLVGSGVLIVGVIGLFLPILQGWLLIGLGAILLAPEVPVFRRLIAWIEGRFPKVRGPLRKFRRWVQGPQAEE
ncbi:MAG: hypothetical protein U1F66_06020 [bacterium]